DTDIHASGGEPSPPTTSRLSVCLNRPFYRAAHPGQRPPGFKTRPPRPSTFPAIARPCPPAGFWPAQGAPPPRLPVSPALPRHLPLFQEWPLLPVTGTTGAAC